MSSKAASLSLPSPLPLLTSPPPRHSNNRSQLSHDPGLFDQRKDFTRCQAPRVLSDVTDRWPPAPCDCHV